MQGDSFLILFGVLDASYKWTDLACGMLRVYMKFSGLEIWFIK